MKKRQGHYCRHCHGMLPNEKFTGRGHAKHVCKQCASKIRADRRAKSKTEVSQG